jgi:penicillin-binding protein 2
MVWQKEDNTAYEIFLKRHKIILMSFILIFICLSIRLFYLQIIKGNKYRKISEQQRIHSTHELAPRGIIYSADNAILVGNEFTYTALYYSFEKYKNASNFDQIIKKLSKILGRKINFTIDNSWKYGGVVKLADNLTIEDMFKIQEKRLSLKGVSIIKETRRVYYYPEATSHVTGYTGEIRYDEIENLPEQNHRIGDYVGRGGIEQFFDKYLKGENGGWQIEVNSKGHQLKAFRYVVPKIGASIYSTIDLRLQKVAYDALKNSNTGKGAVIILNTKTGAVKALISCPGFDTNRAGFRDFKKYLKDKRLPLFNRALQALYPPGSIFKIITFAAAVDLLDIDSFKTIQCTGSFELGDRHYSCWYKPGHGKISLITAMAQSCNVYFYHLGLKLGVKNLEKYAKKFYLGQKTGIDLANEKKGFVPSPEWKSSRLKMSWRQGDTVIFAIGQGALWVTPLQMACVMSIVANKGIHHKPYIVDKIIDFNGNEIYKYKLKFDEKLDLSDRTWVLLHQALLESIETGTGNKSKFSDIRIAGKTGTAQNPQGKDHGWFISYAPYDDPEIAMAIIVEHGGSSGINAVPIGRKIYESYFNMKTTKEVNKVLI